MGNAWTRSPAIVPHHVGREHLQSCTVDGQRLMLCTDLSMALTVLVVPVFALLQMTQAKADKNPIWTCTKCSSLHAAA